MNKIYIYDSTLRDGAQGKNVSFTVKDKIKIVKKLDDAGIDYIEAGNPGSNPKDAEFFNSIKDVELNNSRIVAFGSTRRPGIKASEDINLRHIVESGVKTAAVFGKSWDFHVTDILKTTLDENLEMIRDSISFLVKKGFDVIFDAEHFFDGYKANPDYAMKTLEAAVESGAFSICLCDTRGGTFPTETYDMTKAVVEKFDVEIGIHCHNDNGMAVSSSIAAVEAGAIQVQGTMNGLGERCGNANLTTIVPNLQLLKNYDCIPEKSMASWSETAVFISEVANLALHDDAPFVGSAAFSHKGGMHTDALTKNTKSYELFDPSEVGNKRHILMSEVAGGSSVMKLLGKIDPTVTKKDPRTREIIDRMKEMEFLGYQYEAAEASFELIIRRILGLYNPSFELVEFKVMVNEPNVTNMNSTAMIKIKVRDEYEVTAAEGDGPVDALDGALRKALTKFYPDLGKIKLTDYKVRVLDSEMATAAKVRVLIESTDGKNEWTTIGVSTDIIEASWIALVDSIEYCMCQDG
ncbi:MAG TPA: citramalate synthase [Clostridia bacterium]|nr:citramalate synthase [Clostridia bacterium]HRX42061.1 citramalate synthase [Clostridia bacterium]